MINTQGWNANQIEGLLHPFTLYGPKEINAISIAGLYYFASLPEDVRDDIQTWFNGNEFQSMLEIFSGVAKGMNK